MASEAVWRRILLVAAGIPFAVAAVVLVGVIPPVRTDTFPLTTPEKAVPAFIVSVILHVLLGACLLALVTRRGGGGGKVLLGAVGFLALVFGLPLLDAASAYANHGPGMRVPTVALFACAGGDLVAGVLVLAGAFVRGRNLDKADIFSASQDSSRN